LAKALNEKPWKDMVESMADNKAEHEIHGPRVKEHVDALQDDDVSDDQALKAVEAMKKYKTTHPSYSQQLEKAIMQFAEALLRRYAGEQVKDLKAFEEDSGLLSKLADQLHSAASLANMTWLRTADDKLKKKFTKATMGAAHKAMAIANSKLLAEIDKGEDDTDWNA
jgi:hypothetical protein